MLQEKIEKGRYGGRYGMFRFNVLGLEVKLSFTLFCQYQQTVNLACHEDVTVALSRISPLQLPQFARLSHLQWYFVVVFIKIHKIFHIQATQN